MLHHSPQLDQVFQALADPTRRAVVERLARGPASVSELKAPFEMTLSAIGQHLRLLEEAGLVSSHKQGRVRTVELVPERLALAERWFERHRARWSERLDRLGALLFEENDSEDEGASPALHHGSAGKQDAAQHGARSKRGTPRKEASSGRQKDKKERKRP